MSRPDLTLFVIKPDAYRAVDEIAGMLRGIAAIRAMREFTCSPTLCAQIYGPYVSQHLMPALAEYMGEGPCVAGLSACTIEQMLDVSGRDSLPALCAPATIRRTFSAGEGETASGRYIIRNAIHRPKNAEQNTLQLQPFIELGILPRCG